MRKVKLCKDGKVLKNWRSVKVKLYDQAEARSLSLKNLVLSGTEKPQGLEICVGKVNNLSGKRVFLFFHSLSLFDARFP